MIIKKVKLQKKELTQACRSVAVIIDSCTFCALGM